MSESNVELLAVLQRTRPREGDAGGRLPPPHGQILTFRAGKIAEMVVYGSVAEAFQAAGAA